ncbi:MAG TPA: biotin--[acetyl-CoA-carboxylase] ligase [Candidatus Paceibacterota bacterium]|nr:biotin--[acetyl-CoA-carboxylase] ligase [Candidatus Paceibacterota bacterium]
MASYRLIEFAELDSTNRYACANLRQLADGDVIQAQVQTAGRGRWQRSWVSHVPGNLCLSFVLKPAGVPSELPLASLSQLLAVCVVRVLDRHSVLATLKWPNDIQVDRRKIAGILAESVVEGSEFLGLVLGIGANLNLDAATLATINQPATSLNIALGRTVDVGKFRDDLATEFLAAYPGFLRTGFGAIRDEYLKRFPFIGEPVEIRSPNGMLEGRVQTVNANGELELIDHAGEPKTVTLGEIF